MGRSHIMIIYIRNTMSYCVEGPGLLLSCTPSFGHFVCFQFFPIINIKGYIEHVFLAMVIFEHLLYMCHAWPQMLWQEKKTNETQSTIRIWVMREAFCLVWSRKALGKMEFDSGSWRMSIVRMANTGKLNSKQWRTQFRVLWLEFVRSIW